jgi:hypothetical protein
MRSPEFVLHGTSSAEGAELIKNEGFKTKEGFPNVSDNLIYAFKWATDKKRVQERPRAGSVEGTGAVKVGTDGEKVPQAITTNASKTHDNSIFFISMPPLAKE